MWSKKNFEMEFLKTIFFVTSFWIFFLKVQKIKKNYE